MTMTEIAKMVALTIEKSKKTVLASSGEEIDWPPRKSMKNILETALNSQRVSSREAPKLVLIVITGRNFRSIFNPFASTKAMQEEMATISAE